MLQLITVELHIFLVVAQYHLASSFHVNHHTGENASLCLSFSILFLDTTYRAFSFFSRALKSGLIGLFFHPEQCFSLTNSSSIPPNHSDSSKIQTNEQALSFVCNTGHNTRLVAAVCRLACIISKPCW